MQACSRGHYMSNVGLLLLRWQMLELEQRFDAGLLKGDAVTEVVGQADDARVQGKWKPLALPGARSVASAPFKQHFHANSLAPPMNNINNRIKITNIQKKYTGSPF
jgi:hypothetical protein